MYYHIPHNGNSSKCYLYIILTSSKNIEITADISHDIDSTWHPVPLARTRCCRVPWHAPNRSAPTQRGKIMGEWC